VSTAHLVYTNSMLVAGSRIIGTSVMGLQTGSELGRIADPVINPDTLEIIAYEVTGPLLDIHPSLLRIVDVREFSDIGVIVDSSDEFVAPSDIIKLNDIYELHFDPLGMTVIDEKKHKLGKVTGYTIDTTGFVIQQLSVKRPLFKSLNETELLIHRSQITEINDKAIVVHSEAKIPEPIFSAVKSAYVNPFRKRSQVEQQSDQN
jgi:sporulation protein YlmC with PRC-barrel domain